MQVDQQELFKFLDELNSMLASSSGTSSCFSG